MIPGLDRLSSLLLTLIALSGEFPTSQIRRLPSTDAYKEKVIKSLKSKGLIRTYYRDSLRGLRLTAAAKKRLTDEQPELTSETIFAVYNTGSGRIKWENQAEMRLMAMLKIELCQKRLSRQYIDAIQSGIMFGSTMDQMVSLLDSNRQDGNRFMQDGSSFDPFYFLTSDHHGEVILRLLCNPSKRTVLDSILSQGLSASRPGFVVENDALDGDEPVLFAYTCDMPRIKRFDNALHIHDMRGTLFCFDFQEDAMRQTCGPCVDIQCIDFEAYERSVFLSPENN